MGNLPAVDDDFKCAMSLVEMMGIPDENIFVLKDTNHDNIKMFYTKLTHIVLAKTKELKDPTGILGKPWFTKGLLWSRIKKDAMKLGKFFNRLVVSFRIES